MALTATGHELSKVQREPGCVYQAYAEFYGQQIRAGVLKKEVLECRAVGSQEGAARGRESRGVCVGSGRKIGQCGS